MSSSFQSRSRSARRWSSYWLWAAVVSSVAISLLSVRHQRPGLTIDLHRRAVEAAAGVLEPAVGHLDHLDARGADRLDRALALRSHHYSARRYDLEVADVVGDVLLEVGLDDEVAVAVEPKQRPGVDPRLEREHFVDVERRDQVRDVRAGARSAVEVDPALAADRQHLEVVDARSKVDQRQQLVEPGL